MEPRAERPTGGAVTEAGLRGVSPERGREEGLALILVILVLTALLAIGTPFVLSMKLQERGAVHTVAQREAELAARSARNHALAHLFSTHDSREREQVDDSGTGGHKYDTSEELQPTFAAELALSPEGLEALLSPGDREAVDAGGADSVGYSMRGEGAERTLDAAVEDEQGKINLNTAMPNLIGNLLAGSHLSEGIRYDQALTELPLEDTGPFPTDGDPDTVDGVVVILNPIFFTAEAISYRGKTETHLTGCFRGDYLSGTWEHQAGWPVFDLRGLKVFLHRYYDLGDGVIDTYRTPQAIREIGDWSVVPYFMETLAVVGLDLENMEQFGLTPEMLIRADLGQLLERLEGDPLPVDEEEYAGARRAIVDLGIPAEAVDLVEQFRGKAGVIEIARIVGEQNVSEVQANAFKGLFETTIKNELKKLQGHARGYFPQAIEAYKEIYDLPGLETFTPTDFERIRDSITTYSSVDALWSSEQPILGTISAEPLLGVPSFRLSRYDHFNPGTLVRIRSLTDPTKREYQLVAGAFPSPGRGQRGAGRGTITQGGVILKERLKFEYAEGEAVVSAQLRHPVNINTATPKVIEAVLTGLSQDRFGRRFDSVTATEARALTDLILEARPIRDIGQLEEVVRAAREAEVVDDEDLRTILLNAVNPNHPRLSISTTGFCYASTDVYTIEASGVVRNPAGVATGTRRFREVVEVAPPDPLEFVIDSQDEWTGQLFRREAASLAAWEGATTWLPGRGQRWMTTTPVPLNQKPYESPALDVGGLSPVSLETPAVRGVSLSVEHFPESIEGVEGRPHAVDLGTLDPETPLALDFWIRPNSLGGDQVLFDSLADPSTPFENRVRLLWQGSTRELILQLFDDARRTNWGNREVLPAAEIVHPFGPDLQPDTWTHITAAWASARPGDQVLLVDQRSVGDHTWITELAAPLDTSVVGSVELADAEVAARYPAGGGSLWVGGEVIDYVVREGTRFVIGALDAAREVTPGRGRRGTINRPHPKGTTVRPFGYAVPLIPSDPDLPLQTPGVPIGGTGGASLAEILPPARTDSPSLSIVEGGVEVQAASAVAQRATEPRIRYSYGPLGGWLEPFLVNDAELAVYAGFTPTELGFGQRGYLEVTMRFSPSGNGTEVVTQREVVRFEGWTPAGNGRFEFRIIGRAQFDTEAIDTNAMNGLGGRTVTVRQISVETDVTDLDRRYPPSGVVQLTPPRGDVEWIRYTRIAEGRFFLALPVTIPTAGGPITLQRSLRYFDDVVLDRGLPLGGGETGQGDWPAGTAITPVLRTIRNAAAAWDSVEIAESAPGSPGRREPVALPVRQVLESPRGVFVGLDRPTANSYVTDTVPTLLRFPTGRLPKAHSGRIIVGGGADGSGAAFDGFLDEIRLSQLGPPGEWGLFVTDESGAPKKADLGGRQRAIHSDYDEEADVDAGGGFDRLRLIPLPRLTATGNGLDYSLPDAGQFARGAERALYSVGRGEVLFAEREEEPEPSGSAVLTRTFGDQTDDLDFDARRSTPIDRVTLLSSSDLPPRHGFLRIDTFAGTEILYYERASANELQSVHRGLFGTPIVDIGGIPGLTSISARVIGTVDLDLRARSLLDSIPGGGTLSGVVPIPFLAASRLEGPITDHVPCESARAFPGDGYVRLDDGDRSTADELVGYVARTGNELRLGRDAITQRPLLRGRFGTTAREVDGSVVVVEFLPRYPDRFEAEAESGDLMMWERSISIPGARFDRLSWEVEQDRSGAGRAEVLVLSRLDGVPLWHTRPGEGREELRIFRTPDGANPIGRVADRLDLRIMVRFPPGSYGPAGAGGEWSQDWKRVPVIDRLSIEYRKDWRILHREDLPF